PSPLVIPNEVRDLLFACTTRLPARAESRFFAALGMTIPQGNSLLAIRTVVRASTGDHDALDGHAALSAGLAFAPVDAQLELKKSTFAGGIDVIGNRRTAGADRLFEYFLQR